MRRPSTTTESGPRNLLFAGLLLFLGCLVSHSAASANIYQVTGIRALDGDSIRVRFPSGLEVEVRLLSIDCPEKGQRLADAAKRFTAEAVTGAALVLETGARERDRYQRLLAFVEVGGDSLNRRLINQTGH